MRLLALLLVLLVALAGCSGEKPEGTEAVKTPEGTAPEKTPTPEKTKVAEKGDIKTLMDLFNAKKMYYGKVTIVENGEEKVLEFWYYYDANNNEQLIRMQQPDGVVIMRHKYEGTTLTTTMYAKGMGMGAPQNCEWVEVKMTQQVSPGEAEEVKDEPVGDAFKATVTQQGQIVETYEAKFVDLDLSVFEPDGEVCSIAMMQR